MKTIVKKIQKIKITAKELIDQALDDKTHDMTPPHTFSGENSDKGDYYSFKEDWDHHVALKGTSVADQVRHLTRTCLTAILTMIKMISNLTETTEELIAGRFDIVDESPQP